MIPQKSKSGIMKIIKYINVNGEIRDRGPKGVKQRIIFGGSALR